MTTTIGPALGHGPWTQQGVGTTPGYDAIDVRRLLDGVAAEGVLSSGSYAVTQRGAGANMSVDVAASAGDGARVQGDAVTLQSLYRVPPHSAVINEVVAAAHATLPRNDLVIIEVKDHQHDASGSNLAQTRVITGTPTGGAAQTDALGVNGTPTLPSSAIALAVVNVPAAAASITNATIDDRRGFVWRGGSGGKSIIATSEARTNTAYGLLTTPDLVKGIVLPTDGLIFIAYQAQWSQSASLAARAAIFLGTNQLKAQDITSGGPIVLETNHGTTLSTFCPLVSTGVGLDGVGASATTSDVTTGQSVGYIDSGGGGRGASLAVFAAAGTYDVSVRFKASSGSVTAKERKLWVWTMAFG